MPNQYDIDPVRDAEIAALAEKLGSRRAAARELGIHKETVASAIRRTAMRQVSERGASVLPGMDISAVSDTYDSDGNLKTFSVQQRPGGIESSVEIDKALPGFALKRISTNFRADGTIGQQWQIQSPERAAIAESVREFVKGICEGQPPGPMAAESGSVDEDLLCVYPMGDPHFGMKAHAPEAGENFDLKIAERNTKGVVDRLVSAAPPAKTAILLNLGDFFHADDNSARTKQSGNPLDVDGRWHEVLKVGGWTMVHLVYRLLEKHENVLVYNERGNHDDVSAIAMAVALDMFFHGNPRVTVADPAAYYHFYEFGKNLLGFTHGDGAKENDLPSIMAHDEPEVWGRTKHRVFHRGHFHHDRSVDLVGCTVETHRTLAATDAWHRKSGYRSKRDMKVITYHREYGEIARSRVNLDMI
jgi:hypothetical protein